MLRREWSSSTIASSHSNAGLWTYNNHQFTIAIHTQLWQNWQHLHKHQLSTIIFFFLKESCWVRQTSCGSHIQLQVHALSHVHTLRQSSRSWQSPTYILANCPSVNILMLLYLTLPMSRLCPLKTLGKLPVIFSILPIGTPSVLSIMLTMCGSNGLTSSGGCW